MKRQTLINIYREFNTRNFGGVLVEPGIFALRWKDDLGQFVTSTNGSNRMEFNPNNIKGIPHARAVVYHEMIHQYVEEFLGLDEVNHHGSIFWRNYKMFATNGVELGERL